MMKLQRHEGNLHEDKRSVVRLGSASRLRNSRQLPNNNSQRQGSNDRDSSSVLIVDQSDPAITHMEGGFGRTNSKLKVPQNHYDEETNTLVITCRSLLLFLFAVLLGAVLGISGTTLGIVTMADVRGGTMGTESADDSHSDQNNNDQDSSAVSTIATIQKRGYIQCAVGNAGSPGFATPADDGSYEGLEVDLCRMIAGAIFNGQVETSSEGPRYRINPVSFEDRWTYLASGQADVLFGSTHNMERDIFEPSAQTGFSFSFPYFLDGLTMAGVPDFVDCANTLDFTSSSTCEETRVCVWKGTTHEVILSKLIPESNLVIQEEGDPGFPNVCQVQAHETAFLSPQAIQQLGYSGPYKQGTRLFSREPISIVTRQDDPLFSDLIEWLIQALIFAEEEGITKDSAQQLESTYVFGGNVTNPHPVFDRVFENAIGVRGNYGEMYQYNVQSHLPRGGMNLLNNGSSPIMYSFPFGNADVLGPELELASPTVAAIKKRGFLNCGISVRKGFAELDGNTKTWSGFDVELCKAIAAALFDGVDHVKFTEMLASERFKVLQEKEVDVLARLTTWTMERDIKEPSTGVGMSFSSPYFHDGLKFGGVGLYAECADNLDIFSCQDLKICVLEGTTILTRLRELINDLYIEPKVNFNSIIESLNDGSCNAVAGGFHDVDRQSVLEAGYSGDQVYSVGENLFSKDPLAMTTLQDDPLWSDFVRWIFWAIVHAEENGITQSTATMMPRVRLFGLLRINAFFHAVNTVGNYGEMYNRNFGGLIPRGGLHELNTEFGPMLRALPGISTPTSKTIHR